MLAWQRTVYICFFGAFLSALGLSQLAPLLPIYLNELGVTTTNETAYWSGLAMGITYLVVALVSPYWGRLADRKGRKISLLRASFGMMLCNLLMCFVQSPLQLVLVRFIHGLVSGFFLSLHHSSGLRNTGRKNGLGAVGAGLIQSGRFTHRPVNRRLLGRYIWRPLLLFHHCVLPRRRLFTGIFLCPRILYAGA